MLLVVATDHDLAAVADLVNRAYRGQAAEAGWTHEAHLLDGQRTDEVSLRADLAAKPGAVILTLRQETWDKPFASVWLEPLADNIWLLGMLTVDPARQDGGIGRALIDTAEAYARARGGQAIKMTVIEGRDSLIAWYGRRGYVPTGAYEPFPYGDQRFGQPKVDDLRFVVLRKGLQA